MEYSIQKKTSGTDFPALVQKTKEALAEQGFGILTEIDVQATLKKKLNVDYGQYVILGACNPPLAYQALQAEKEIGLFLPCNVIVYEKNSELYVSAINPTSAMGGIGNELLMAVAVAAEKKLIVALENIN